MALPSEAGAEVDCYGAVTAVHYDRVYEQVRAAEDIGFYKSLAREAAGPVLELACGTGRVLLEIAHEGFPCTGLDLSPHMLEKLRAKPRPRTLRLVRAPMQSFDLGKDRFTLIYCAFRGFQHLYTAEDQLDCLARVRAHLAPGGIFACDVFAPRYANLAREEEGEREDARYREGDDWIVRYTSLRREYARQLLHLRMRYERRRAEQAVASEVVKFQMRWFHRFELEHLFARAGFDSVEIYGGFDRRPYDYVSGETVLIARSRGPEPRAGEGGRVVV